MAYYTVTQAKTFYTDSATAPNQWSSLTDAEIGIYLEMASDRFDALPWLAAYNTETLRKANSSIEAAFYEYVRYLISRGGAGSELRGEIDDPDNINVLTDLPTNVGSRLLPFLDSSKLTVTQEQGATVTVGDTTINYNPAKETASQAAERYARARKADARGC